LPLSSLVVLLTAKQGAAFVAHQWRIRAAMRRQRLR